MIGFSHVGFSHQSRPRTKPVFADCSIEFDEHKLHAVIGRSGCGKTTMLYLLAGLLAPDSGVVHATTDDRGHAGRRALILQEYGLLEWKTVRENIALGLVLRRGSRQEIAAKVDKIMEETGLLQLESSYPPQLSGGEKQRCAIARALVVEPDLLLMDEPFSALDAMTRESMQDLLLRIRQSRSMTIVMVTHGIEEAVYLADMIHVMHQHPEGDIRISGTAWFSPPVGNIGKSEYGASWRTSSEWFSTCVMIRRLLDQGGRS